MPHFNGVEYKIEEDGKDSYDPRRDNANLEDPEIEPGFATFG